MSAASDSERTQISEAEAQYRLLHSIVVAGKSAEFTYAAMRRFLTGSGNILPFDWIAQLLERGLFDEHLRASRIGCYGRIGRSFREVATKRPDLRTVQPRDLLEIHGIGPKTARFAVMWVRPHERHAALDTHILKWLRFLGHNAPRATPSEPRYSVLEKTFIAEADRRRLTPRMLDAMIWAHASHNPTDAATGVWPAWLQPTPALPPPQIVAYFEKFVA